jgi:hypothetical protein
MTVGDSIFLSAVLLSIVALYAATKDRWNWKRLVKWVVGFPMVLLVVGGVGLWAYSEYGDRPTPQTVFGGVTLTSTAADVRLAKGNPSKLLQDGRWLYYAGSGSAETTSAAYVIRFKDSKIRYVMYAATPRQSAHPWLQGFTIGTPYETVLSKLGPPSHTSTSADGLERMVSYEKYNTFYSFEQAKVSDFGLYSPSAGPMEHRPNQAEPAASAADEATTREVSKP